MKNLKMNLEKELAKANKRLDNYIGIHGRENTDTNEYGYLMGEINTLENTIAMVNGGYTK